MNVKSKEIKENSMIELVIEVGAAEFEAAVEAAYNKQKKSISVPGFRKGKAPRKIVESVYGAEIFYSDAIDATWPAAYEEALKAENIDAAADPRGLEVVEIGKDGYSFKAQVTVKPEAKLNKYKGLKAPKPEVVITEEDIDNELKVYIDRATRLVSVDRPAQEGDTVVLDYIGLRDGVPFQGGSAEKYPLKLGSHSFIPGFEEQVVGITVGEERDLHVTFPEEYHAAELAGVEVMFQVKAHEIKEQELPVVDDEFAKDVSEFETLAEFRASLGEKLKAKRTESAEHAFEDGIMKQLIANLEVEIPGPMVEDRAQNVVAELMINMRSQGIPESQFENYLAYMGTTKDGLMLQAMNSAHAQIKRELALEAVAAAEGIVITDEDCDAEFAKIAEDAKMSVEDVKSAFRIDDIKLDLLQKKTREVVLANAEIGEPDPVEAPAAEETAEETAEEKKPAKKTTRKKKADTETAEAAEGEEKKPAKKTCTRKKKTETEGEAAEEGEEKKPAKKTTRKKKEETTEE